ncbi:MAG: hypothetical protein NE327_16720 [Lentisphaeraceae bacterium]|nr:hypothetical protein [Lentisphaeraceae bacterium]
MLSTELKTAIDQLGEEAGIKKVFLFDHTAEFIYEDSKNTFTEQGRIYCNEQIQSLTALSQEYRIYNEELTYDLEDARATILFLDYTILMVFIDADSDHTSIRIALNSVGRKVNTLTAREAAAKKQQENKSPTPKLKPRFASRSSSIDKNTLPDVVEADSSFIIYLKKLITHYAGAKAARELNNYLHEKQIHIESLDSLSAYNLIEGLVNYLEMDNAEDFKVDAQQVLNRYF